MPRPRRSRRRCRRASTLLRFQLLEPVERPGRQRLFGDRPPRITRRYSLNFYVNDGIETEVEDLPRGVREVRRDGVEVGAGEEMEALWEARRDLAPVMEAWYDPPRRPVKPGDVTVPISDYPDDGPVREVTKPRDGLRRGAPLRPTPATATSTTTSSWTSTTPTSGQRAGGLGCHRRPCVSNPACTSTGEHGVGQEKREDPVAEDGESGSRRCGRSSARSTRRTRSNPGKIFPETVGGGRVRADTPE